MLHTKITDFQELPSSSQIEIQRDTPAESMEEIQSSAENMTASDEIEVNVNNEKREIGQYWEINNGGVSLYVVVMGKDRCMVYFFDSNRNAYPLNDILEFEVLLEEFV